MKWFIILLIGAIGLVLFLNREKISEFWGKENTSRRKGLNKETDGGGKSSSLEPSNQGKEPPTSPKQPNFDPIAEKYPIPNFKPIETLVGNWKKIPPSAFPRQVTVKVKAKYIFAGGAGSSTIPAGRKTTALSLSDGQLIIAPGKQSSIRGRIAIDDTDYKEILGAEYEKYKLRKRKEVMARRDRARAIAAAEPENSETTYIPSSSVIIATASLLPKEILSQYENEIGKIPRLENNGRVTLMVKSLQAGDVSEIKLNEISYWGPVRYEMVGGQPFWTGTVNYKTTSLFGTFTTEAMALMRNGKVINWLYTGSLEEVP